MNDPDTHTRAATDPRLLHAALPPYLVAGNRYGSYGFGAGLTGFLLALAPFGHAVAWLLVPAAIGLGATGFIKYAQDGATNRDTSLVGLALGWIALVVLLVELAVSLNLPPEAFSYAGP